MMGFLGIGGGKDDDAGKDGPRGLYLFSIPIWENPAARDASREDREDRQDTRVDGRSDRVETRQGGRTDRVESRQGGRTDRVESRQGGRTDRSAIRNADGSGPLDDVGAAAGGLLGGLQGIVGSLGSGVLGPIVPVAIGGVVVVGAVVAFKAYNGRR